MRHRLSARTRALALGLAVGLGGLLVGLSVAPRLLPGETFRLKPRNAAAATDKAGLTVAPRPSSDPGDASLLLVTELLAVVTAAIVLGAGARGIVRIAPRRRRLAVPALSAVLCRGPPLFS